jgi:hypothetical protein
MQEAEWLTSREPSRMLDHVRHPALQRKMWLFATACCRRVSHLFHLPGSQALVDATEARADGRISDDEWKDAVCHLPIRGLVEGPGTSPADRADFAAGQLLLCDAFEAARDASFQAFASMQLKEGPQAPWHFYEPTACPLFSGPWPENHPERSVQADLFRDIFGNPFRPVAVEPSWRTSTVLPLASRMYELRDFSTMPILADALQDAGCTEPAVLDHCRCGGTHVRGCWLIDLLLNKA